MGSHPLIVCLPGIVLVFVHLYRRSARFVARSCGHPLPPGPPGVPVLGNLFDIPKDLPWKGYRDLSRRYGWYLDILLL